MRKTTKALAILFVLSLVSAQLFAQLAVSITHTNVTCNGGTNGVAVATPSGGTGSYSYSWTPAGGTAATASSLAAGNYTVTLTDTIGTGPATATLYAQDFEGTHGWTLNVVTGTQGTDPNYWTVSAAEGGVLPPGCGVANNGNKTLHVTAVMSPSGAVYDAGGLCGVWTCPQSDSRAESPAFSTLTYTGTTLEFDFISYGSGLDDNASVWYDSGSGWTMISASIKSLLCGGGQGTWTHYTSALPASCDNNAAVKVGIRWVNNDDGVGTDPSIAINNVVVTGVNGSVPVVQTATATVTITEPAAIASSQTVTLCPGDTLVVGSSNYTSAGTYTNVLAAQNGCDSTVTSNLSFYAAVDTSVTVNANVITANAASATYQWIDCGNGNAPIPGETNQTYTASANGDYAVIVTANGCSDTSACVNINTTGLAKGGAHASVSVYPNPAGECITILATDVSVLAVAIFDVNGRCVFQKNIANRTRIDVAALECGVYTLTAKAGERVINRKLIIVR